jgi:ureidoglycolate lyase
VNYHRGTWHHYLLALGAPSEFVVVDRVGPGDNCDEQMLAEPLTLVLPG